jgi:hypothetical protein
MSLDIRIPIGSMFLIIGAILAVLGLATGKSTIYKIHSLGINVNLGWGCVLMAFGLFMLTMAYVAWKRSKERRDGP